MVLATHIKELWFSAYPEMRDYFEWISSKVDSRDKYNYETPLGMVRQGASFCAASNGAALQSPSAEGFKEALWRVVRACWDETQGDLLFGSIPLAPIHDEIIIEVEDDSRRNDKAEQLSLLMEESMRHVLPGVITKAEPCLMYRWKKADGVYDNKGKLIPIEEA